MQKAGGMAYTVRLGSLCWKNYDGVDGFTINMSWWTSIQKWGCVSLCCLKPQALQHGLYVCCFFSRKKAWNVIHQIPYVNVLLLYTHFFSCKFQSQVFQTKICEH